MSLFFLDYLYASNYNIYSQNIVALSGLGREFKTAYLASAVSLEHSFSPVINGLDARYNSRQSEHFNLHYFGEGRVLLIVTIVQKAMTDCSYTFNKLFSHSL